MIQGWRQDNKQDINTRGNINNDMAMWKALSAMGEIPDSNLFIVLLNLFICTMWHFYRM